MNDKASRTWKRVAMDSPVKSHAIEARRALVLHDRALVVDLITLTLTHGVFAVRAASTLAEAGSYELTAATTGISPALVRNVLIEIRGHYCAATTIQAYRAALAAGDLPTPGVHWPTGRS